MPTRVDGDLYEAAQQVGAAASRSAAQQISHWARIGRELEASPRVSARDIQRVLAGEARYDNLTEAEQARVRVEWDEQFSARVASLDLAAEFTERRRPWSEAGADGEAVVRGADPR